MRGIRCRGLRLEMVAGLGIALAIPTPALWAENEATQTSLSAETQDRSGHTQASVSVSVRGVSGSPAAGAVTVRDNGKDIAGVLLNNEGQASLSLALTGGEHQLQAVYLGDAQHHGSISESSRIHAMLSGTPDYGVSISPTTVSLTAGQSATVIVTLAPENSASLTEPMFVTLSCSGNPDQSSCTFTPGSVEIKQGTTTAVTSSMVLATQIGAAQATPTIIGRRPSPMTLALLPGALALMGLVWGSGRSWLRRVSLLTLVGMVTVLGTTGCNPLWRYQNHGPPTLQPTPAGTYTMQVTAQSTNGVTAITHSTSLVLTVK